MIEILLFKFAATFFGLSAVVAVINLIESSEFTEKVAAFLFLLCISFLVASGLFFMWG